MEIEPEDLLKFGLIPEFVGRVPVLATLMDLDEDALVDILTSPRNALVKQYQRLFEMENVKVEFTEDALRAVAQKAIQRKTGARGLRSIMESILLDPMYELAGAGIRRRGGHQQGSRGRPRGNRSTSIPNAAKIWNRPRHNGTPPRRPGPRCAVGLAGLLVKT